MRLKFVGNDVDLWEMAKIYGKWLYYLTNGLNMYELTKCFGKWLRYMVPRLKYLRYGISMLQMT